MKKRVIALILTGLIFTALTGCGENDSESSPATGALSTSEANGAGGTNDANGTDPSEIDTDIHVLSDLKELGDIRLSYNGTVYVSQAYQSPDSDDVYFPAEVVQTLAGQTMDLAQFQGESYASFSGMDSCVYDEPLSSLYVWADLPDSYQPDNTADATRISYYELGEMSDRTITYKEFFALLDRAVAIADDTKLPDWEQMLPKARESEAEMTRFECTSALLYAATALGNPYTSYNFDWGTINAKIGLALWDELSGFWENAEATERLPGSETYALGGFEEDSYIADWSFDTVAAFYGFGRCSLVNGKTLLDYDEAANTMHYGDALTVTDALCAVSRFLDSVEGTLERKWLPVEDASLRHYDETVITEAHFQCIKDMPEVSDDNLPVWHGVVVDNGGYVYNADFKQDLTMDEFSIRKLSEYGFNIARFPVSYDTFFDRNAQHANPDALQRLDAIIAMAMKYRIHLNLVTTTLPGRWTKFNPDTYENEGEYDMFVNPDRQREARAVWDLLAERYADIPSSVLSFSPMWEISNPNLSSGLDAPAYTASDAADAYVMLIDTIRSKDDDRFIIYEPSANNDPESFLEMAAVAEAVETHFDNVQIMGNFCEILYVFSDMTGEEGANIDAENHGLFKPEYPVTYYGVSAVTESGADLTFQGELADGTEINLYLLSSWGPGKLSVYGDGELLYEEAIPSGNRNYDKGPSVSMAIHYSKSNKAVSIVLDKKYENVRVCCDTSLIWCGIDVTLPESYAVERWYYDSGYDAYLEGREWVPPTLTKTSRILISPEYGATARTITIHPDVRFTTDEIWDEASPRTMELFAETLDQTSQNGVFRCENVGSSVGTSLDSALRYYEDFIKTCENHHIGWIMNDGCGSDGAILFKRDLTNTWTNFSGLTFVVCGDALVCPELMQLYQSHMEQPIRLDP